MTAFDSLADLIMPIYDRHNYEVEHYIEIDIQAAYNIELGDDEIDLLIDLMRLWKERL